MLNMRGTNPVTVQDVKSQLRIMKRMVTETVKKLETSVEKMFKKQDKRIDKVKKIVMGDDEGDDDSSGMGDDDDLIIGAEG